MKWYFKVLKNFALFSGRARRKEYWMFVLTDIITSIVLMIIETMFYADVIGYVTENEMMILVPIYYLITFLPRMAVSVRRLHDINKSGWRLLWMVVPLGALVLLVDFSKKGNMGINDYGS
ncbi:MAG: DUF805 domain-containing protein, partial [Anaerocolumna sp.]